MTTYHRYLIADGGSVKMHELRQCLQARDPAYDLDGELITHSGINRGILVDITHRGDQVFDEDLDLLKSHADKDQRCDDLRRGMDRSICMVTVQVGCNCDEVAMQAIWQWLHDRKKGILAYEGGGFRIDN